VQPTFVRGVVADKTGIQLKVSGASAVTLSGQGRKMALEASGAGQGNLEKFAVSDASVDLSGASRATVNVSGRLDADASGASALRYTGSPTLGSINSSVRQALIKP
jgi:hypothetical protein